MSSSQSNAAARRRRAQPAVAPSKNSIAGRIPQHQPQFQANQSNSSENGSSGNGTKYSNPAQMLIAHEGRLNKIEDLVNKISDEGISTSSVVGTENPEQVNNYITRISELEEQISQLEHQYKMLQIFCVETNVALMKILDLSKTASSYLNGDIKQELINSQTEEIKTEEPNSSENGQVDETTTNGETDDNNDNNDNNDNKDNNDEETEGVTFPTTQ